MLVYLGDARIYFIPDFDRFFFDVNFYIADSK